MPNQPNVNRVTTFVRLPLELMAKLRSLAAERKMTFTQIVQFIIHEYVDDRPLSLQDMAWIEEQRAANMRKRQGEKL